MNILIIEDDGALRKVMAKVLRMSGHQVSEAEDGRVGLRLFREDAFDLVVSDLLMPEKEGIETIMELRENNPDLPILAVSGGFATDREGPLHDAEILGASASLAKPFTVQEFSDAVEALLRQ